MTRSASGGEYSLARLRAIFASHGVVEIYAKDLAPNDNSKNQPYLARGDLKALNMFPVGPFRVEAKGKRPNFKAPFPLWWVRGDGEAVPAPGAQLIVYPKYPEVRISGFLTGVDGGPNQLMTSRSPGRVLFLGVTKDRRVLGWVCGAEAEAAHAFNREKPSLERSGLLWRLPLGVADNLRANLLVELARIHQLGWVPSQRLSARGIVPCRGTNCGGCTLEALLGIASNSAVEPDFDGWELKSHRTSHFSKTPTSALTLMTPAPTAGIYKTLGLEEFLNRFGYPDKKGLPRTNFSSPHHINTRNRNTSLTLELRGCDDNGRILDATGGVALVDDDGAIAASWNFSDLMSHWTLKHARAAFVPYMKSEGEPTQYSYSNEVSLAEGTDFSLFLKALSAGDIVYDPGTWRSLDGKRHERSQFRIAPKKLQLLYHRFTVIDVNAPV